MTDKENKSETQNVDDIQVEKFDYNLTPYQTVTTELDEHNEQR